MLSSKRTGSSLVPHYSVQQCRKRRRRHGPSRIGLYPPSLPTHVVAAARRSAPVQCIDVVHRCSAPASGHAVGLRPPE